MKLKSSSNLLYGIVIILFIWAIFSFWGIFSFIAEAEYHFQEPYVIEPTRGIDYIISIDFKSKGGFIAGKKIDADIEVSRGIGKKFVSGENRIFIGNFGTSYAYPLSKEEKGVYSGGIIELTLTENGEKLVGSDSILFSRPGEYPIYSALTFFTEDGRITIPSENKIPISRPEVWLSIEQNNRIFSLTLIILALTLISLYYQNKK
ncbi:hypothetical protein KY366_03990 [Candidatus Woesearchaeota archaeon]|nr:hypothetical protein [Candidatus Woesearchaeota archaeon]